MAEGIDRSDPLWFKDTTIYQLHIKSYYDSNGDGYGDIRGLIEKLDYIQDLGVDCLWLLPFYPSPLRDDGYDIADYEDINPIYGNVKDFQQFLDEAHRRGIRVITELVINHTSDQHPWFQRARHAPKGSPERDFYVWSDNENLYKDVRIIFVDYEKSNWTYDPVAQQYYWHRFFHHQPDLNYDNPAVFEYVTNVMRKWLDMGVDGLRLDAIPYLIERDGTNCENLPETHGVLKDMRRVLDQHYTDRIFLAEANQWPSDVREYFGNGDECHMAYHFPVMPRLYMAVHMEDRHPITDILRQTPEIPENCQWAMFLRNHDELTLEMVTDEERDYMYKAYAKNPLMKINVGIRRRLAPLLEFSRPRIELLNSLLFSLPGTPIVYYGDEIGMGENIYLGDRNGVRTPMQWSPDRNAGFSKAMFAQLYSPPLMDPITGYQSINVEAQQLDPSSLLNWMKGIIKLRKKHKVFGRGSIEILQPENRKIFAYIRKYEDETVLCVANLSRYPQSVSLDLKDYAGLIPVEMFGMSPFHAIGNEPYLLTLGPYAFYWLMLSFSKESMPSSAPRDVQEAIASERQAEPEIVHAEGGATWETILSGGTLASIESTLLPPYIQRQRWFGKKTEQISAVKLRDWCPVEGTDGVIALVDVTTGKSTDVYSLYLSLARGKRMRELLSERPESIVGEIKFDGTSGVIHNALVDDSFCHKLLALMLDQRSLDTKKGTVLGVKTKELNEIIGGELPTQVRQVSSEQSNSSLIFGNKLILKLYRRVYEGDNPDYELGLYLTEKTSFRNTPLVAGGITYRSKNTAEDNKMMLGLLQQFITNQGDGWTYTVEEFRRFYERANTHAHLLPHVDPGKRSLAQLVESDISDAVTGMLGIYLSEAETLGKRTAEMHIALGKSTDNPRFAPETASSDYLKKTAHDAKEVMARVFKNLALKRPHQSEPLQKLLGELDSYKRELETTCDHLPDYANKLKRIRCHGDFHLGQVMDVFGDWIIFDFEGEPARPMEARIEKMPALKDVAGMLRSFGYAAYASLFMFAHNRTEDLPRFEPWAQALEMWSSVAFLQGYLAAIKDSDVVPSDKNEFFGALSVYLIDKAFYEIEYEMNNRPDWLGIPIISVVHQMRSRLQQEGNK